MQDEAEFVWQMSSLSNFREIKLLLLIISDLHIGKGRFFKNGQLNILEDFQEDERLVEFLDYYCSDQYYEKEVHLVLNGDILNFLQIDKEGVFSHIITENDAVDMLDDIIKGHYSIFMALRKFLSTPNKKITYIVGNHDAAIEWEKVIIRLKEEIGSNLDVLNKIVVDGIHIEHGHRFEMINTVPKGKKFIKGPTGEEILNLPWGSLFCILLLPILKKDRPYIDKVRPLPQYLKWCLFHDFTNFLYMAKTLISYYIRTRLNYNTKQNRNFKTTLRILKEVTIYPKYEKQAKKILETNLNIHSVVMGHSHLVEWRKFPEGKLYFNSGTWNIIPSIDAGLSETSSKRTYVSFELEGKDKKIVQNASLNVWQGQWKPYREEVSLTTSNSPRKINKYISRRKSF